MSAVIDERWRLERPEAEPLADPRTSTQVDRDRLLYSSSLARLAEVTQVVSSDHGYVFHNRLTHSLKVAQLSRRIAEKLLREQPNDVRLMGGLDPDAAETAGLAHDLGHPPFGHIAEEQLDEAIKRIDSRKGYEGNAQSFRMVSKLLVGDPIAASDSRPLGPGLNLTRASLNGILKYPWKMNGNPAKPRKWGAYEAESDLFEWVRKDFDAEFGCNVKSLEAEVMDWADNITYAVHDVVDFYCAGKIPLERFSESKSLVLGAFYSEVFDRPGNENLQAKRPELEKRFNFVCENFFTSIEIRFDGSCEQRKTLWQMMTSLITRYVSGIKIKHVHDGKKLVEINQDFQNEIAMLKQLTWHYVILNTDLATVQHGQKHIVNYVFTEFYKAATEKADIKLLPKFFEELVSKSNDSEKSQFVADCVSGMTETEITGIYKKLIGVKSGNLFR